MTPCPTLATYKLVTGPAVPEWVGRYVVTKQRKSGDVLTFLPIVFTGHTEDDVIEAADIFWREQQRKEAAKVNRSAAARAARGKAS